MRLDHSQQLRLTQEMKLAFDSIDDSAYATSDPRRVVSAYAVYRSETSTGARTFVAYFPRTGGSGVDAQVIIDDATFLPGCTMAVALRKEVLSSRQLLPPTTFDLAKIADNHRWMQLQYTVPILHVPIHTRLFINVGRPPSPGNN